MVTLILLEFSKKGMILLQLTFEKTLILSDMLCVLFIRVNLISIVSITFEKGLPIGKENFCLLEVGWCSLIQYCQVFLAGIQRSLMWNGVSKIIKSIGSNGTKRACLGIKNLELFNISLLSKWKWRLDHYYKKDFLHQLKYAFYVGY